MEPTNQIEKKQTKKQKNRKEKKNYKQIIKT